MANDVECALNMSSKKWVIMVDIIPWRARQKMNLALENLIFSVIEKIWKCTQIPAQPMAKAKSSIWARVFMIAEQPFVTSSKVGIIMFIIDVGSPKKSKASKIMLIKKDWSMMLKRAEKNITKAHILNVAVEVSKQDLTRATENDSSEFLILFSKFSQLLL